MELFYRILKTLIVITILKGYTVKCNCEYKPCDGVPHTMCTYPETLDKSVASCSGPDAKAGLTDAQRSAILHKHNELRQRIAQGKVSPQPPAANMMKLTWNGEVETIAQRYMNACGPMKHDKCRVLMDGTSVGQNLASTKIIEGADRTLEIEKLVQLWYDEVKKLTNLGTIDSFSSKNHNDVVGHYTQLVWAKSTLLGCGFREGKKEVIMGFYFQDVVLACNYAVRGNLLDAPVYVQGKACSKCPDKTHCSKKYPGLCTEENENEEYKVWEYKNGGEENDKGKGKKGGSRSDIDKISPSYKFITICIIIVSFLG